MSFIIDHPVLTGGGDWAGAMTFKGGSKEAKRSHLPPPKRPKMAQNQHIPQYNKKTKQLLCVKIGLYYLLYRKQAKSDYVFRNRVPL